MTPRHDWRMVPLAAAAWMGGFLGTLGTWNPLAAGVVATVTAVAAVLAARRGRVIAALTLLVLLVTGVLAGLRVAHIHDSTPAVWAQDRERVSITLRITTESRLAVPKPGRPELAIAEGQLLSIESRHGKLRLRQSVVVFGSAERAADLLELTPGATYQLSGRAAATDRSAPEPLTVSLQSVPAHLKPPGALDRLVNQLRGGLRQAASHSPPDQAALVPSLVVGDTAQVSQELSEQFRVTALSHLLAVSGANLTLMLSVLLILVRCLGVRGWAVRFAALLGVGLFVVLCRFEASVIRAAAMGLVTLLAMGMSSGQRTLRGIAVTVTCLMFIDPWLSRSYAFALSVAACLGICLWALPWVEKMAGWAPRWLAEAFCVPLAAQLATQPIITSLSGQISVVGVFANMLAAPFVGPTTVLGLIAACVSFIPPLAAVFAWLAGWCVQPIIWIGHYGSQLPTAALEWQADAAGLAASAVLCLLLGSVAGWVLSRRVASLFVVGVLLTASLMRPVPLGWPGPWSVVFCDVGQGDATVLRAADRVAVVVDTGPEPRQTLRCLNQLGIRRIPLLVLTHYHADHIGGTAEILRRYSPELVLVSPLSSPAHAAEAVRQEAVAAGSRVVVASPGQEFTVGDLEWTTVGASTGGTRSAPDAILESGAENDASVIGVAEVAGLRVLLPGDVEPAGQRRAMAAAADLGLSLDAHVLKLPHHGSARQDEGFFRAVGASLAVVSAGQDNDYGHPAPSVLALSAEFGMHVVRTDQDGSIAVAVADGRLSVRTHRRRPRPSDRDGVSKGRCSARPRRGVRVGVAGSPLSNRLGAGIIVSPDLWQFS